MLMSDEQRAALLAELHLTPEEAAAPAVAPTVDVAEVEAAVEQAVTPVSMLVVPTFSSADFVGVTLDEPAECEAAYRVLFDKHKVHRQISPGYNKELTKSIRSAIKTERATRKPATVGFVKAKIAQSKAESAPVEAPAYPAELVAEITRQVIAAMQKGE